MASVLVVIDTSGEVEIVCPDKSIDTLLINMSWRYTFNNNICKVLSVNEDCTVNVKIIDSTDHRIHRTTLMNINPEQLEVYSELDEDEDDDLFDLDDDE